jgi:two-component system, LuxR family, response regulator TtrR
MNHLEASTMPNHTVALTKPRGLVYVVDDDDAVRDSMRWLLEGNGFTVRCFADAESLLRTLPQERQALCLVLDVRMPGMSGIELHEKLLSQSVQIPVIFVTGHGDVPMAVESMKRGAVDFLEKPFNDVELCALIDKALHSAAKTSDESGALQRAQSGYEKLSTREREVLALIVKGRLNKQIADDLSISIKTVEAHRANIMDKMAARNMAELMKSALRVISI